MKNITKEHINYKQTSLTMQVNIKITNVCSVIMGEATYFRDFLSAVLCPFNFG